MSTCLIVKLLFVPQAAQDKEELQREGDELDAKIRKAEKEMRALENTLRLMNGGNETYRKSFNKVTETSKLSAVCQELYSEMKLVFVPEILALMLI